MRFGDVDCLAETVDVLSGVTGYERFLPSVRISVTPRTPPMLPPRIVLPIGLFLFFHPASVLPAAESLSARIDTLVETEQVGPVAAIAGDAEFLRRVTLDLHGVIPSSTEARAFIDDASPNKREMLVDRLLSSPRYAIHMANVVDVMLMERRPDKHVPTAEWQRYLQVAFQNNVPYDRLVRDILSADGVDPSLRPAAKFFLDRDAEPNTMARDVGRIFFGMDLQCAQCHDHPLVDHYLQTDYYGLYAFVNRTIVFADEASKKSVLGEKSDGEANYKSVFTQDAGHIRPQLPGENEIDEPRFRQGEDYIAAPLPGVRPVPKYSRRAKLAELATNGANRQFNLNIANRLWGHMMGRGLVHPVDLHHPLNPPTHPAVLDLITSEFVTMKYDIRWLLRELALSRTYQRSIEPPTELAPQLATAARQIPGLTAEYVSLKGISDESRKLADAAQTEFKAVRATLAAAEAGWRAAEATVTAVKKPVDDLLVAIAKLNKDATAKQAAVTLLAEAVGKSTEATKLLPGDKEVAGAVATLTAKQTQLTGELAALQKSIADQTAAMPPIQAKLVEAYAPADAAYAAYVEARKPVDAAKTNLITVWNRHKAETLATAIRKKRLEADEAHVAFLSTLENIAKTKLEIDLQRTELAAAVSAADQQQLDLTGKVNAVAEVEKGVTEARKLLDESKAMLAEKQTIVQAVMEAFAKTEFALQKIPGDAELTSAVQKLKERLEPLVKEGSVLEQTTAGRAAAMIEVESKLTAAKLAMVTASTDLTNRQQMVGQKTAVLNRTLESLRNTEMAVDAGREKLVDQWTVAAGVRSLKQLTPEQFAWALMQSTGVLDPQRPAADAEIEKTIPKGSVANDAALAKSREMRVEQQLHEAMRGNVTPFINLYAASAGQPQDDFFATPDQALFVANGGTVTGWAGVGALSQRLGPMTDAKSFADELYLSALTRYPSEMEVNEAAQYLASRPAERPQAIRELIWSLVTSAEFRFNH
jgi:Protein of unknown function (DUF1549)/Protein of unknown function (DUF1553)